MQKVRPEGVWGPRWRNKSEKHVWGLRHHTFFSLLLRALGPQIPFRAQCCAILNLYIPQCTCGWTTTRLGADTHTHTFLQRLERIETSAVESPPARRCSTRRRTTRQDDGRRHDSVSEQRATRIQIKISIKSRGMCAPVPYRMGRRRAP